MPKHQGPNNLIGTATVAQKFGISRVTLWRWERGGILPRAHRINNPKILSPCRVRILKSIGSAAWWGSRCGLWCHTVDLLLRPTQLVCA
jgi:hypothetical protein